MDDLLHSSDNRWIRRNFRICKAWLCNLCFKAKPYPAKRFI